MYCSTTRPRNEDMKIDNTFFMSMIQIKLVINSLMMNQFENMSWWLGLIQYFWSAGVHRRPSHCRVYVWWHDADSIVALCCAKSPRTHPKVHSGHARTRHDGVTLKEYHPTGPHKHYSQLPQGKGFQPAHPGPNQLQILMTKCGPRKHIFHSLNREKLVEK